MRKIILASASPRRSELLQKAGLDYIVHPSQVDEKISCAQPDQVVQELALQKAEDVAQHGGFDLRTQVVLGADTVVSVEGKILGKPGCFERACEMLESIQGREHQVYTGVALIWEDETGRRRQKTFAETARVVLYPMEAEEIQDYAGTGEPFDKAGAYGIQGRAMKYIEKISGDYNNVVGLPVARVYQELRQIPNARKEEERE